MADPSPTDPAPEAATRAADPAVTAAFELLSSEVRLSILLALWEAHDPYGADDDVSFTSLYDSVDVDDSANFTYHLDKLRGQFVAKTDDGYRLRNAGLLIVQAIIAGSGLDDAAIPVTEIDLTCHRCGAGAVRFRYENGAVLLTCPDCEGFTTADEYPAGTVGKFWFDPAGLPGRSPPELLAASVVATENRSRMMESGVCPACSGPIEDSLRLCEDHQSDAETVCPNCDTRDSARVRYVCPLCKHRNRRPVELTMVDHPAVHGFYRDHDVDPRWDLDDVEGCLRNMERLWAMEHELVSTDPVRIRVTVPCQGDELSLFLDGNRDVVEVRERS